MENQERDLLQEVIETKLNTALNATTDEVKEQAFKDAMQAVDRGNERQKSYDSYVEQQNKLDLENNKLELDKEKLELEKAKFDYTKMLDERESRKLELEIEKFEFEKEKSKKEAAAKKDDNKRTIIIKAIELGVPIVTIFVKFILDRKNVKLIANFEQDNTWTTTPGRSLSKKLFDK